MVFGIENERGSQSQFSRRQRSRPPSSHPVWLSNRSYAATITAITTSAWNERADHKNDACLRAITSLSDLDEDGTRGTTEALYTAGAHRSVEALL